MNKVRDLLDLSALYEATKLADPKAKFGTKPGKPLHAIPSVEITEPLQNDGQPAQPYFHKDSGPENADGFNKNIVDPKTNKGEDNHYEPEKFSNNVKKKVKENINNFMNNKSIFDKLYEDVMGGEGQPQDMEALDAQQLDIDTGDEGEKSEAEMTSKELIAKALELLQLAHEKCPADENGTDENGTDEEGAGEENFEMGQEQQEGAREVAGEAVDAEEIGHAVVDAEKLSKGLNKNSSGSNVVPSEVSTQGKKAGKGGDGKYTTKVGTDGEKGHALVGGGVSGGAPTSVKGKANVVSSKIVAGKSAFNV